MEIRFESYSLRAMQSHMTELFENTTMVATLIDRITICSHVLDMNGESYRLKSTIS